ncbi:ATP-binding protein [Syntrophus aciditrophicus]|uniref:ATPase n=1 Tax=Syntrophus aciditrophicus (strain SB) TaxID=56780 RepID=Q2LSU4_SYNAS|nr:ATP-binding protein [Syntrophus aciditrophicus]ABC77152.1 ATPase [Syntrophus aciditrophicus SB]OPY16718.1 MAG: Archaeal ATPase [Syntrophus sp. PtaB.Bin075]
MNFVDRHDELSFLRSAYQEDRSQLVVIYGKRRVGKTALVKEFSKNLPHIYFLADKAPDRDQLSQLSEKVGLYFQDDFLLSRGFGNWYDFFKYIKSKGKFVMIFDEFPYLIESNPAVPSLFQKGWDEDLSQSGVFLILLGSSMGMMETEVLGHKSPLFGRRTGQILVEPLSFSDAKNLFPATSDDVFMQIYGILGGTPAYLLQFDPSADFWENVRRRILIPEAYLYREPDFILREELREPRNYFSILRAISMGKTRPAEIINETGFDKNLVGKYLSVLIDLKIIRREVPVTEWGSEKSKKGMYLLEDHFFRFWFHYVYPNRSFIEEGQIDYILDKKIRPSLDRFISWSFEEVCRSLVRKGLPQGIQCNRVGRWWSKDGEIDIVGLAEDENMILFGEAKWSVNPVGTNVLDNLEKKAQLVDWRKGERKEFFVIFSRSGFTQNLEKRAEEQGNLLLWR